MSSVTQRIPNLLRGISQQPDNRKFPGQVKDAVNTFPDYALGMLKRPGGKYEAKLQGASTGGRWFSILRDAQEKYVAQYDDNVFRVWSLLDGSPRKVDMGTNTGVQSGCNYTNLQTDLLAYNTAVADTAAKLKLLKTAEDEFAVVNAGQKATTSRLFKVNYKYPVGDLNEYLTSGILEDSSGNYVVKNNDTIISQGSSTLPTNYALGTEVTDEHPNLASQGFRVYEAILTTAATHSSSDLTTKTTALTTAKTNYDNAVTAEATAYTAYNSEVTSCAIADGQVPSNAYLKDATADDIEFLTLNDYTFVLNKTKEVAMKSTTTAALPNQAFVVINVVAYNVDYKVLLTIGNSTTTFTHSTPAAAVINNSAQAKTDANSIASALASSINANSNYTAVQVGPGISITSSSSFKIEVRGGSQQDGIYAFQNSVPNVSRLPIQAKNGYKLKIINTTDIDIDDMWVKFETSNGQTYGAGAWVETNGPGIQFELDELTLPHQLVRQADGSFKYEPVNWADRVVGDDNTNPLPSFIGEKIKSMFFFRNRFGVLANDAVILSKAGDFFNFFVTSAKTATDDDPIDISASSTRPVFLNYVQPTAVGLVLFGENDQFYLTTDSDTLSPLTAKINKLSSFEADPGVEAVSLGTSMVFIAKTPLYTHMYELMNISTDQPPTSRDTTQNVPELIPDSIDNLICSPGLSMVSMASKNKETIYQYRFFNSGDNRVVETWYKWEMTGKVLDQFFDNSTYYAVVHDDTRVYALSFDMNQSSEQGFLTLPTGEKTDVCLDLWTTNPPVAYNSSTKKSTYTLPFNAITGKKLSLVNTTDGSLLEPTFSGNTFDVDGDFRGQDVVVGLNYDMKLELPKLYVFSQSGDNVSNDDVSNLIIHRIKVSTGLSGPVDYKIDITGLSDWENVVSVTLPYLYNLNKVNMLASATHNVPIFQRNENLGILIEGTTPYPVSLLGFSWEGRYTTKFYKRV